MEYKKPAFSMIALSLASATLASLCLMTYPVAQKPVHIEDRDDNFEVENDVQDEINDVNPEFEHTNRGLTVTTTDQSPTDGKYTNFRLIRSDNEYVDFSGNALAEYTPYVYYKVMNGDEDPETPEITSCGESKVIINFVTEHTNDTHKEEVHIFDAKTMKEHNILDVGAEIAENIKIRETQSHYVFEFFSTKVVMSKSDAESRGIDLSGDLIFGSNYRYYLARVGTCTEERDFVCEMLWREADGDAFAKVEVKYYFMGSRYFISSAKLYYVDNPDTRIYRCDDINILNFEKTYPTFSVN